jgi:hypothetical protein
VTDARADPVIVAHVLPDTAAPGVPAAPAETSVLLNLLPHALDTLKREPALGITLAYLLVAMAGIFYNYSFYQKFGIPVLMLSQISDFLTAGIQEPMAMLLVFSTFPLCWFFDKINSRNRRRRAQKLQRLRQMAEPSFGQHALMRFLSWRVEQRWYMGVVYLLVVTGYGWVFVSVYAVQHADTVKTGNAPQVNVWLSGDASPLAAQSKTWSYLGAVSNYVFVYDHVGHRAEILPVNNITRIEPIVPAKAPSSAVTVLPIP